MNTEKHTLPKKRFTYKKKQKHKIGKRERIISQIPIACYI